MSSHVQATLTSKESVGGADPSSRASSYNTFRVAPSTLGLTFSGTLVSRGVPVCSTEGGLSPTPLVARTRTLYSTPSVSPVMVWMVPDAVASETSAGVSQLSALSCHCTL